MTVDARQRYEQALEYAARGWRVLPVHGMTWSGEHGWVCTCVDGPRCVNDGKQAGKHPIMRGRFEAYATTDAQRLARWWDTWPEANVAVLMGESSGVWCLDIDDVTWMEREGETGDLLRKARDAAGIAVVKTGGGGLHLWFAWDVGQLVRTHVGLLPKVDVKASGYVLAPPSVHRSGGGYEWESGRIPSLLTRLDTEVVTGLRRIVEQERSSRQEAGDWTGGGLPSLHEMLHGDGLGEGERDSGIFHAAWYMLTKLRMPRAEIVPVLIAIADRCQPPFPRAEAVAKLQSAIRRYEQQQAGLPSWQRDWAGGLDK